MPRHTGDRSRPKTEAYPRGTRSPNTVPSSGESACELAGKKAIITHIEEVMAHLLVGGGLPRLPGPVPRPSGTHLGLADERYKPDLNAHVRQAARFPG
jgi:hypothetical protein